ncbi:mandelate racemase/muconate lactonizing enzyme family protein [Dinoroseobacter sp. S76]|uniref:mandelate racemase/muconate lactonizing enzyme family protein n=1 Tax=Dinoroseobacter sp. S76 TaxID=3415124 RepID=UPI003C79D93F
MSRITRVEILSHCNALGGKVWNPAIRWSDKFAVFLAVEDDTGQIGIGECWCFDAAPDALIAFLRTEVVPQFLGAPLDALEEISGRMLDKATLTARHGILCSALSGFDLAVWDLRARQAGKPLWQLLDPAGPGEARVYGSGGLYGLDKTAAHLRDEIAGMVADGHDTAKMKIGALPAADDAARVLAALQALPPGKRLIVDGVYSYSAAEAQALFDRLPGDRILAFQSPVPASDLAGMRALTDAGVPVMAVEAEYRPELQTQLVAEGCVRFLQVAPIAVGGVSRIRALCDLVTETPVELSLEVSSTAFAFLAAAQMAAASPQIAHVEYHYVHHVFFDRLEARPSKGSFALPDPPGIGFELPHDQLTRLARLAVEDATPLTHHLPSIDA